MVLGVAAVLLVVAGATKLRDPSPTGAALAAVAATPSPGAVRAIGAGEVVLGAAALLTANAAAAMAVTVAYVAFAAFVVVALGRDVPSCGCFGTAGGRPAPHHLVVDLLLAAAAAAAALTGARSLPDLAADRPLTLVAVAAGAILAYGALTIGRRDGAPAPAAGAGRAAGDVDGLDLTTGRTALVFLSTSCLTCREIWRALAEGRDALPAGVQPVVVTKGDERPDAVAALAPPGVTVVRSSSAWERFGVTVAPAVVLVDGGEVVASGLTGSWDEVLALSGR